jgi:hypothetical protein
VSDRGRVEKSNSRSLLLDRGELGHCEMMTSISATRRNLFVPNSAVVDRIVLRAPRHSFRSFPLALIGTT